MAYYRKGYKRNIGREKALEHIRQAEDLTKELGGVDQDVKQYFFSLSPYQMKEIFDKYEQNYGNSAREYAEKTLPRWKAGNVKMSGLVAERLFNLLPPIMPMETKYLLIESLWKHVGKSTSKNYYIGLNANLEQLSDIIKKHLESVVINYSIPRYMESRFKWLSAGDVDVKQKLLNYFQYQERSLLSEALLINLPILLNHLNSDKSALTTHLVQTLKVGKHEIIVTIDERIDGISENPYTQPVKKDGIDWFWWIVTIFTMFMLFHK
jgi:hypothetical protein